MNTLIYNDLDIKHASMASSMASTAQYLAMSFGIALATLLMEALLQGHAHEDYIVAFRWTVLLLAPSPPRPAGYSAACARPGPRPVAGGGIE
jgi:hypothetical protein